MQTLVAPTDTRIGLRFRGILNHWLTRSLALGLMDDDSGRGPRVVFHLGEKATIWGAVLRDRSNGATKSIAAVNYQF